MNGNISVNGQMIALVRKHLPGMIAQQIVGVQPMPIDAGAFFAPYKPKSLKYKFSRAHWYVAEFDIKYYSEVDEWCAEQFGPHPSNPDAWSRWVHKYSEKIHFAYEKDYVLFMLRWG